MRINCVMHVAEEGPAAIGEWAQKNGCLLTYTCLYKGADFPALDSFDMLLVMGGPMSFDDDEKYEWMSAEKTFIKNAVEANKKVMGICLGAQFVAIALGSKGCHSYSKEIGWFPVEFDQKALTGIVGLPEHLTVFHWHGDTFEIPEGAACFASSNEFPNQAFVYDKRVFGLQFHLEATQDSVNTMVEAFKNELIPDTYIQSAEVILSQKDNILTGNSLLFNLLNHLKQL